MTPEIKAATRADIFMNLALKPENKFPAKYVKAAQGLMERWERENWGRGLFVEHLSDAAEESSLTATSPTTTTTTAAAAAATGGAATTTPAALPPAKALSKIPRSVTDKKDGAPRTVRAPPRDHPIFGEQGIMHGTVLSHGKKGRRYRLNVNCPRRSAANFGHNGLQAGAWFPMQIVALARGAHGASQAGISGHQELGAYSIVVAGTYHDLDSDEGDTLYYTGSQSHKNTDPNYAGDSTSTTNMLKKSLENGRPVRVLRSASSKSAWAPSVGMRYDGLYRVVSLRHPTNAKGGKYEQFKLVREPGQLPLQSLFHTSPSHEQAKAFKKISQGY